MLGFFVFLGDLPAKGNFQVSRGEGYLNAQASAGFFLVCSQTCMVTRVFCGRAVLRCAPEWQLAVAAVASVHIDVVRLSGLHQ